MVEMSVYKEEFDLFKFGMVTLDKHAARLL